MEKKPGFWRRAFVMGILALVGWVGICLGARALARWLFP